MKRNPTIYELRESSHKVAMTIHPEGVLRRNRKYCYTLPQMLDAIKIYGLESYTKEILSWSHSEYRQYDVKHFRTEKEAKDYCKEMSNKFGIKNYGTNKPDIIGDRWYSFNYTPGTFFTECDGIWECCVWVEAYEMFHPKFVRELILG